jgi:hypothetical protein
MDLPPEEGLDYTAGLRAVAADCFFLVGLRSAIRPLPGGGAPTVPGRHAFGGLLRGEVHALLEEALGLADPGGRQLWVDRLAVESGAMDGGADEHRQGVALSGEGGDLGLGGGVGRVAIGWLPSELASGLETRPA